MARSFASASSQYLQSASAPVTAMPLTIAVWAKSTTFNNATGIMASLTRKGNNQCWSIDTNAGGTVAANSFDGVNVDASTIASGSNSVWHQVTGVFTSTTSRTIYQDGIAGTLNATSINPASIDAFNVACRDTASGGPQLFFNGQIAEAAVWSVALTADEIVALSKGVSPNLIRPTSLVAYYPLLDSAAPDLDRWNGGFNLTPTNTPTMADHLAMFYRASGMAFLASSLAYTLALDVGSYTTTGFTMATRATRRLALNVGSYAVTGVTTNLHKGYVLTLAVGSYLTTGFAATLVRRLVGRLLLTGSYIRNRILKGSL